MATLMIIIMREGGGVDDDDDGDAAGAYDVDDDYACVRARSNMGMILMRTNIMLNATYVYCDEN